MKSLPFFILFTILSISNLLSCGVKGPPQPPQTPAELGRGLPLLTEEESSTVLNNSNNKDRRLSQPTEKFNEDPEQGHQAHSGSRQNKLGH